MELTTRTYIVRDLTGTYPAYAVDVWTQDGDAVCLGGVIIEAIPRAELVIDHDGGGSDTWLAMVYDSLHEISPPNGLGRDLLHVTDGADRAMMCELYRDELDADTTDEEIGVWLIDGA